MIRRSVDYRQDLTNQIRLCKFLVGDTPRINIRQGTGQYVNWNTAYGTGGVWCCDFEEEGHRHRIAFNSLFLFSLRSIIYEANGEELYNSRVEQLWISNWVSAPPPWGAFDSILEAWPPWHGIYPDWLVLSARHLVYYVCCHLVARWKYYSKYIFGRVPLWLCEDITACCYMYCYFRNIFPPWSSQMTILLITSAMYHIRHTNGEYEYKRKNPPRIDYRETLTSPTDLILGNPPLYTGG